MNNSSCVRYPEHNRYIQLNEWMVRFTDGNHCAALLLAFFLGWHEYKIKHDEYYKRFNNIAEMHGDGRPHSEDAYLFFTAQDLSDGMMGIYGAKAIASALNILESLNVISIHANPNRRYHFDKTKYYKVYPKVCNYWIEENYPIYVKDSTEAIQPIDFKDHAKMPDGISKKACTSGENATPSGEKAQYIKNNTTNNTTNKNQSIKRPNDFFDEEKKITSQNEEPTTVQAVVDALSQHGFSEKYFAYPDTVKTIENLCDSGATVEIFLEAFSVAKRVSSKGFGVNYLAKVVADLIGRKKAKLILSAPAAVNTERIPDFHEDYSGSENWMGDLVV